MIYIYIIYKCLTSMRNILKSISINSKLFTEIDINKTSCIFERLAES